MPPPTPPSSRVLAAVAEAYGPADSDSQDTRYVYHLVNGTLADATSRRHMRQSVRNRLKGYQECLEDLKGSREHELIAEFSLEARNLAIILEAGEAATSYQERGEQVPYQPRYVAWMKAMGIPTKTRAEDIPNHNPRMRFTEWIDHHRNLYMGGSWQPISDQEDWTKYLQQQARLEAAEHL